jgi:hypothetical protein
MMRIQRISFSRESVLIDFSFLDSGFYFNMLAMSMGSIIKFYNLYTKSPEEESVYGECF